MDINLLIGGGQSEVAGQFSDYVFDHKKDESVQSLGGAKPACVSVYFLETTAELLLDRNHEIEFEDIKRIITPFEKIIGGYLVRQEQPRGYQGGADNPASRVV